MRVPRGFGSKLLCCSALHIDFGHPPSRPCFPPFVALVQCEIIIGGDKYGALCFLEEVAKIAKLMQEVINDIKAREFQKLVKYVGEPQNLPHYGANDITDCVVKKVRAEYTCQPTQKKQFLMALL